MERERDLLRIADMYCSRKTQNAIAEEIGVSQMVISRDIAEIIQRWKAEAAHEIDEHKARELADIDRLERTYWEAWEESKNEKQSTVTESVTGGPGAGARNRARVSKEKLLGNPAYLSGVQWCIDRRCKILGIDAPQRHEHSGPDGEPIPLSLADLALKARNVSAIA